MSWISSRFSTLQLNLFSRQQVERATSSLQLAAKEMTTGLKVDVYADLGPMAAVTLSLRSTEQQTQSYITANGVLTSKIDAVLTAVDSVRETVSGIFEQVAVNAARQTSGTSTLQIQATAALKTLISTLNLNYNGDYLFSGVSSESSALQNWESQNPDTTYSPKSAFEAIVGTGPTTTTEAASMMDDIDQIFASTYTTDSTMNFESTFYNGKPALDSSGDDNVRVTARIDPNRVLDYGVQANDDAFKDLYKGLAMLASVNVDDIADEETYQAWMASVGDALSSGISGALTTSTRLGFYQQVIEDTVVRQQDLSFVYRSQINGFESVDPYEAATRVSALETQLQASYSIAARLADLTILNYF